MKGKVAVVTGGSEGIGKGAALSLAAEGAEVVICARRRRRSGTRRRRDSADDRGEEVTAVTTDVTKADQISALFRTAVAEHGRIDILVNNAGTSSAGHFEDATDEKWKADLDLKFHAAIRCSREAIPHMRAQGGGRIINVTTVGGKAPAGGSVPTSVSAARPESRSPRRCQRTTATRTYWSTPYASGLSRAARASGHGSGTEPSIPD